MGIGNVVKRLNDVMWKDDGVAGDAQRLEQIVWILFLKVYDDKEKIWEFHDSNFKSILPEELRWRSWAVDKKDGKALTGDELLSFVNEKLFPGIEKLDINENTPISKAIVKYTFDDVNNYMKNGILLRQVINIIDEIKFTNSNEKHEFNEIYETMLKELQSAGNAGEFYTPRPVTNFMVEMINPSLKDKIADFACGTGGFLTSTLDYLKNQVKTVEDKELYDNSIYGIEKKSLPYLLCITNLLLHDIDEPNIEHRNSFDRNVKDYKENEKYDVVLMNPPYGGHEVKNIQANFPSNLRGSETFDLFMTLIMYRLKQDGRCAVILPDGFLFGVDNTKVNIKEKLMKDFNLHTIVRMPSSVFAPYTSITTNILFFDKTKPTDKVWFYRMDMPEGYKNFSKTKPILNKHFDNVKEWWNDRKEIIDEKESEEQTTTYKSKRYTIKEIIDNGYNIDLCGYPHKEEIILEPKELIEQYQEQRASLNAEIDKILAEVSKLLEEE
ncbi:MAG TPA: type I restriction-modification system subunit M [Clostridiaceae bacterium]|nr:type I restriction-modification system subunit M [Clostridiaceae bacterium]